MSRGAVNSYSTAGPAAARRSVPRPVSRPSGCHWMVPCGRCLGHTAHAAPLFIQDRLAMDGEGAFIVTSAPLCGGQLSGRNGAGDLQFAVHVLVDAVFAG